MGREAAAHVMGKNVEEGERFRVVVRDSCSGECSPLSWDPPHQSAQYGVSCPNSRFFFIINT